MTKNKKTGESLKDMFKNGVKASKRSNVKASKRFDVKTSKPKNVKSPKRQTVKKSKSQNVQPLKSSDSSNEKNKHTIYLSKNISKKLQHAKVERETTLSQLIEEVLTRELKDE